MNQEGCSNLEYIVLDFIDWRGEHESLIWYGEMEVEDGYING